MPTIVNSFCMKTILLMAMGLLWTVPAKAGSWDLGGHAFHSREKFYPGALLRWLPARRWGAQPGVIVPDPSSRRALAVGALLALAVPWAVVTKDRLSVYALGAVFDVLLASPVVQPWYVLWLLPLACLHRLWSALAWTWLAGFAYIVLDPGLRDRTWIYPAWQWAWIAEYAVVYGLLTIELFRRLKPAGVTNWNLALLTFRRNPWMP